MTRYTLNVHTDAETPVTARLGHTSDPYGNLTIGDATIFFRDAALLREVADAANALAVALGEATTAPPSDVWPQP